MPEKWNRFENFRVPPSPSLCGLDNSCWYILRFVIGLLSNVSDGQSIPGNGNQYIFNPSSAGMDFRRQNLTSTDVRY